MWKKAEASQVSNHTSKLEPDAPIALPWPPAWKQSQQGSFSNNLLAKSSQILHS